MPEQMTPQEMRRVVERIIRDLRDEADEIRTDSGTLELGEADRKATALQQMLAEHQRYEQALRTIREQYGKVCDDYENCDHVACDSSYAAWAAADAALSPDDAEVTPHDG